ncbi:MAG TPA: CBS domain-containing protein [Dehalococcoidia bacterium]|nr:CBS domain-containing protein [Dehalococcoidia bacterium]
MICPECKFDNIEGVDTCSNCGSDLFSLDHPASEYAPKTVEFVEQRLADIPTQSPVRVETTDPVGLAVRLMQNSDTDCILVMKGTTLAGIITPWDILHKVAGPTEDLNAVTCGEVMTADPVCLRDDDNVAVALNKMSVGGFRHIPLLQGGTPTAVVSIRDVFRHISPHLA